MVNQVTKLCFDSPLKMAVYFRDRFGFRMEWLEWIILIADQYKASPFLDTWTFSILSVSALFSDCLSDHI